MVNSNLLIFLAGLLSFQIQLVASKSLMPTFGGSAAVWLGSLMFYQAALLISYLISFKIGQSESGPKNFLKYTLLTLALSLGLKLAPDFKLNNPLLDLIIQLFKHNGLLYINLLMISPLLQKFEKMENPYKYYASSNLGAFLGLFLYPLILEPLFNNSTVYHGWLVLAVMTLVVGSLKISKHKSDVAKETLATPNRIQITVYSALGTLILGAYSSLMMQNLAGFPLLWTLPLFLYLVAFALVFADVAKKLKDWIGNQNLNIIQIILVVHLTNLTHQLPPNISLLSYLVFASLVFLVVIKKLADYKPKAEYVSGFYLYVALGGAIGGVVINLIVPMVLKTANEINFILLILLALITWKNNLNRKKQVVAYLSLVVLVGLTISLNLKMNSNLSYYSRNFYGSIMVEEIKGQDVSENQKDKNLNLKENKSNEIEPAKVMYHGPIVHGVQYLNSPLKPTVYYQDQMGMGQTILEKQSQSRSIKIGAVGLGIGVLATYGRDTDFITFYEIDPQVKFVAETQFTFLKNSRSEVKTLIGDGRKLLEENQESFDLLIVDAFSGDSIPVHLLTSEALDLYKSRLNPGGELLIHISNNHIDLHPVITNLAKATGWDLKILSKQQNKINSSWARLKPTDQKSEVDNVWTDDYSSLLPLLKIK